MKLILPPHEITTKAGPGGAIRAEATRLLMEASVVGDIEEIRPPEQLAVEHGLATPYDLLETQQLGKLVLRQQ